MDKVADLLNRMVESGIIENYAVFGAKDYARVLALRETGAVSDKQISELAARFDLTAAWNKFLGRFHET